MDINTLMEFAPWTVTFIISLYALNKERINNLFYRRKKSIEIKVDGENLERSQLENVEQSVKILKDLLDTNKEHSAFIIDDLRSHFDSLIEKLKLQLMEANQLLEDQQKINKEQRFICARHKSVITAYEKKYGKLDM